MYSMPVFLMYLGALGITLLTPTTLVYRPLQWWLVAVVVATGSPIASLGVVLSAPHGNLLTRDIIAWVSLSAGSALGLAALSRWLALKTNSTSVPTIVCVLALIAIVTVTPLLLLLVHCTSGDCL